MSELNSGWERATPDRYDWECCFEITPDKDCNAQVGPDGFVSPVSFDAACAAHAEAMGVFKKPVAPAEPTAGEPFYLDDVMPEGARLEFLSGFNDRWMVVVRSAYPTGHPREVDRKFRDEPWRILTADNIARPVVFEKRPAAARCEAWCGKSYETAYYDGCPTMEVAGTWGTETRAPFFIPHNPGNRNLAFCSRSCRGRAAKPAESVPTAEVSRPKPACRWTCSPRFGTHGPGCPNAPVELSAEARGLLRDISAIARVKGRYGNESGLSDLPGYSDWHSKQTGRTSFTADTPPRAAVKVRREYVTEEWKDPEWTGTEVA